MNNLIDVTSTELIEIRRCNRTKSTSIASLTRKAKPRMGKFNIVVLAGDYAGPEVTAEAVKVSSC